MALVDVLSSNVDSILSQEWNLRDGTVVPTTETVNLGGGGVHLEATMLYADLADSTELSMNYDRRIAAKVFKSFLTCASKIIKDCGGDIRSFDGDRVMGVFIGANKNTAAAMAALKINYAFIKIIKPKLEAKYQVLKTGTYKLAHSTGIDTSDVLVVRGGVREHNDLVWIGRSPNVAAKLSAIRESPHHSFITEAVYNQLHEKAKLGGSNKQNMWERRSWNKAGVNTVYRSSWIWTP